MSGTVSLLLKLHAMDHVLHTTLHLVQFCWFQLDYTLCNSTQNYFQWQPFYSYAYMVIHHALHTGFGISISSPCWNQKAWNHKHRTWIIRYKLCHCLRKNGYGFDSYFWSHPLCKSFCPTQIASVTSSHFLHVQHKREFPVDTCFFICLYCLSSGYLPTLWNEIRPCSTSFRLQFSVCRLNSMHLLIFLSSGYPTRLLHKALFLSVYSWVKVLAQLRSRARKGLYCPATAELPSAVTVLSKGFSLLWLLIRSRTALFYGGIFPTGHTEHCVRYIQPSSAAGRWCSRAPRRDINLLPEAV